MNALVDSGASCRKISARVNGRDPANGLAERDLYYTKACKVIMSVNTEGNGARVALKGLQ